MTRARRADAGTNGPEEGSGNSLPLFLSLFLLLLAFFVFLNSISSIEAGRSDAVLQSVRSSFPSIFSGGEGPSALEDGGQVFDPGLRQRIAEVLVQARPLLAEAPFTEGDPIYADFVVERMFPKGSFEPEAEVRRVLDMMAPLIADPGAGQRLDLALFIGYREERGGRLDIGRLSRLRLAALGDATRAAGIAGDRVSIGFEPGDASVLRLVLRTGATRSGGLVGEDGVADRRRP